MSQILIVTDSTESSGEVVYRERVDPIHLASEHSRRQLAERLAWAVGDAARAGRPALTSPGRELRPSEPPSFQVRYLSGRQTAQGR